MLATYYSCFTDTRHREMNRLAHGHVMSPQHNQDSISKSPILCFCLHSIQSWVLLPVKKERGVPRTWNTITPVASDWLLRATKATWNLLSWKSSGGKAFIRNPPRRDIPRGPVAKTQCRGLDPTGRIKDPMFYNQDQAQPSKQLKRKKKFFFFFFFKEILLGQ